MLRLHKLITSATKLHSSLTCLNLNIFYIHLNFAKANYRKPTQNTQFISSIAYICMYMYSIHDCRYPGIIITNLAHIPSQASQALQQQKTFAIRKKNKQNIYSLISVPARQDRADPQHIANSSTIKLAANLKEHLRSGIVDVALIDRCPNINTSDGFIIFHGVHFQFFIYLKTPTEWMEREPCIFYMYSVFFIYKYIDCVPLKLYTDSVCSGMSTKLNKTHVNVKSTNFYPRFVLR